VSAFGGDGVAMPQETAEKKSGRFAFRRR